MKPYGLVAAAPTTSAGSSPSGAQISANSLASEMFTARKVFSSSFTNSAASGELTWWTFLVMVESRLAAAAVQAGVAPPTTRGTWSCGKRALAGSIRSGAKATCRSCPTRMLCFSSGLISRSLVVPAYEVEVRMINWPGRAWSMTVRQAAWSGPSSGTWWLSIGVGTHTSTASARASPLGSAARRKRSWSSSATPRRRWSSGSRSTSPERMAARRLGLTSSPSTRKPASWNASAVGRPT